MKWIHLLLVTLFPFLGFSQAQVTGKYSVNGKFSIGTNAVDQMIQAMKKPDASLVAGGGLVAAHLSVTGILSGDTPTTCGTWFDLSGNNFNWTSITTGTTNQPAIGTAGTNQIGQVGIPCLILSSNAGFQTRMECNSLAPMFNIPNTGQSTNGGLTIITLWRPRAVLRANYFSLAASSGGGNGNTIAAASAQASSTQRKYSFGATTNGAMIDITLGVAGVTNRWGFDLVSYAPDGTVTIMNNLSNSTSSTLSFGTNFSFNFLTLGCLHRASGYLNRSEGDYAGDCIFTNAMTDGTSRTNAINALDRIFHFIQ